MEKPVQYEDFRVLGKVLWENWGYTLPESCNYMSQVVINGLKAEGYEIRGIETKKDPD